MLNLQPIAGWNAEETIIPSKRLKLQSYHVFGCPEFVGTPRIKTKKRPPLTAQEADKQINLNAIIAERKRNVKY